MATRYARDPFWLEARYAGSCAQCGAQFPRGTRIFYYPISKSSYCPADTCGGAASRDFQAAAWDEDRGW